jgi:hypothetical protein
MSSIETDADVNIKINAEDNASLVIDESTKRINRSFTQMRIQQRQVTREFEINNRVLVQGSRVLSSLGRVVSRTISIYNTFQLHQLRLTQAQERTRESTKNLNDVFLEFGVGREYEDALKRKQKDTEDLKRLADETALIIGLTALTAVTTVSSIISRTLPLILKFKAGFGSTASQGAVSGLGKAGGAGLASKIGSGISKFPKAGLPIVGAGLFASELIGGQEAGGAFSDPSGKEIAPKGLDITGESGIDAIARTAGDIYTTIINVFSPSSQETVDEISDNVKQSLPFGTSES